MHYLCGQLEYDSWVMCMWKEEDRCSVLIETHASDSISSLGEKKIIFEHSILSYFACTYLRWWKWKQFFLLSHACAQRLLFSQGV